MRRVLSCLVLVIAVIACVQAAGAQTEASKRRLEKKEEVPEPLSRVKSLEQMADDHAAPSYDEARSERARERTAHLSPAA